MQTIYSLTLLSLVSFLGGCGNGDDASVPVRSQPPPDVPLPVKPPEEAAAEIQDLTPLAAELENVLTKANQRVQLGRTRPRAPARDDGKRFPAFKRHNESRWDLELDPSKVPPGTLYEQTTETEEGGSVSEYLVFDRDEITWWFDGRKDAFSEFKNPSVRRMKVSGVFLAVHDGKSGWKRVVEKTAMPLDHGLAIGIRLEDGSCRYW